MTTPRRLVIQDARPGSFHLISRCVRQAFLCGRAGEHPGRLTGLLAGAPDGLWKRLRTERGGLPEPSVK